MVELRFGVLGPFEARFGNQPIAVPGAAERALLALLLLSPSRGYPQQA